MIDILKEFEKRYYGDASATMAICADIASEFGLDVDEVADFVYINRYQGEDGE